MGRVLAELPTFLDFQKLRLQDVSLGTQKAILRALPCALRYLDLGKSGEQALGAEVHLFMGKAHLFFRFYQAGKVQPVPKSPVSSGPFLGFLGWTRPTGWRLPDGLRDMCRADPQITQQLCP